MSFSDASPIITGTRVQADVQWYVAVVCFAMGV